MKACIASKDLIETGSERVQLDLSTGDVCSEVLNRYGDFCHPMQQYWGQLCKQYNRQELGHMV